MHAFTPSSIRSWIALALLGGTTAAVTALAPAAPSQVPSVDVIPFTEERPPTIAGCEHWPENLRGAMQTCSMAGWMDTNERWLFGIRATIVDHRMVDMSITSIDHDCDYCFDNEAPGREDRAHLTLSSVSACIQEQLSAMTFQDANCMLDTNWSIRNDW